MDYLRKNYNPTLYKKFTFLGKVFRARLFMVEWN